MSKRLRRVKGDDIRRTVLRWAPRIAIGLPALLTGAGALAFALSAWVAPDDPLIARYVREAARRLSAKDYQGARLCYERLVQLSEERPEFLLGLAESLAGAGNTRRSEAIVSELAPADRPGYAPAHLWQARRLLGRAVLTPHDLGAAESHLLRFLQARPEDAEANTLLGQLYAATGRPAQAEPYLEKAAKERPEVLFLLATVASTQGKRDEVRRRAELARTVFRRRAEAHPDDCEARVRWAAAAALLEDLPGAIEVLQQGLLHSDDPRYHQALARAYAAQFDALAKGARASLGDRLALLERGLKHNPGDPALFERLLAIIRTNGSEAERGRATLQALLAGGQATEIVHLALGIDAWERGKPEQAWLHWEQAHRLAPEMPIVANNLAWVLAHAQLPDLPRALKLVNQAIERWPDDPRCRDTRGYILVKMQRWKDALPDLEAALRSTPDDVDLHRALAEAYDHLGETDMAAAHRRRAGAQGGATR